MKSKPTIPIEYFFFHILKYAEKMTIVLWIIHNHRDKQVDFLSASYLASVDKLLPGRPYHSERTSLI